MSPWEQAVGELEAATLAMEAMDFDGVEAARAILDRRSRAIARLGDLRESWLALPPAVRERLAERLRAAERAGASASLRLARSKGGVTLEWSRWNQVRRALTCGIRPGAPTIDCRG